MTIKQFIKTWSRDWRDIFLHELKQIFSDSAVLLIFLVAGMVYPLLYNVVYLNGVLSDTPIAVVDEASCAETRRFIRELDATREMAIVAKCVNMEEAKTLMRDGKVRGIIYFPRDFGEKLVRVEPAKFSIYCDMGCFMYYKNAMIGTNFVMLHEIGQIQVERYAKAGLSEQEISQLVKPIGYEDNNPYNRAFSYNIFLISAIFMVIIQQTLFYGMSLLVGTQRERNHSFASLPDKLGGHGMVRVVLGRGMAYWLLYIMIGLYIAFLVPAIFGLPQKGQFWDIVVLLLYYVADCVFFSMTCSSIITRRESVFLLFLIASPVCLLLTGCSYPSASIPKFWKVVSYFLPTTFGAQAFINLNTAGGDINAALFQIRMIITQTIFYFALSCACIYVENWLIRHKPVIDETRARIDARRGIDRAGDRKIITGE